MSLVVDLFDDGSDMKPVQPVKAVRQKVVVMRLPNLAAQATEIESPDAEATLPETQPANNNAPRKVAPRVLQSVIAGGAIVVIIAAYFIFNGESSSPGTDEQIGANVKPPAPSLANVDEPQLDPPRPLLPTPIESEPNDSELVLNVSQPPTTGEPQTAPTDFDDFNLSPIREPADQNSMQLNGPGASIPPHPAVSESFTAKSDYPTTDPERWRYPEFEIRSPLEAPAAAPRFADRMGGSSPRANERDATTWERR